METVGTEPATLHSQPTNADPLPVILDTKCFTHDLSQLLTAILCHVSLAKCTLSQDDAAFRKLTEAEVASLRAKDLIQQFAQIGSAQSQPVKTRVDLKAVIQEARQSALCGSHVPCFCHIPQDLWPLLADEGQISRVFQNLLLNARQASRDGGLITVQAENIMLGPHDPILDRAPALSPGPYIMVVVEDQGMGIAEDILPSIFHPNFTTKPQGSGLGLAITHSIISQHRGHITVTSTLHVGTTFTVYLPAEATAHTC